MKTRINVEEMIEEQRMIDHMALLTENAKSSDEIEECFNEYAEAVDCLVKDFSEGANVSQESIKDSVKKAIENIVAFFNKIYKKIMDFIRGIRQKFQSNSKQTKEVHQKAKQSTEKDLNQKIDIDILNNLTTQILLDYSIKHTEIKDLVFPKITISQELKDFIDYLYKVVTRVSQGDIEDLTELDKLRQLKLEFDRSEPKQGDPKYHTSRELIIVDNRSSKLIGGEFLEVVPKTTSEPLIDVNVEYSLSDIKSQVIDKLKTYLDTCSKVTEDYSVHVVQSLNKLESIVDMEKNKFQRLSEKDDRYSNVSIHLIHLTVMILKLLMSVRGVFSTLSFSHDQVTKLHEKMCNFLIDS